MSERVFDLGPSFFFGLIGVGMVFFLQTIVEIFNPPLCVRITIPLLIIALAYLGGQYLVWREVREK